VTSVLSTQDENHSERAVKPQTTVLRWFAEGGLDDAPQGRLPSIREVVNE